MRLTHDFIAIEYLNRSYTDSKELLEDSRNIIDEFLKEMSITVVTRLGLRYINRFDLDTEISKPINWGNYFSKDLIGPVTFANKLKQPLSRVMSNLYLKLKDSDILVVFGIWNQDFPSENTRKEFILDIDAYSRLSFEINDGISQYIKEYNADIEKVFEKSLGAEIKKILNRK